MTTTVPTITASRSPLHVLAAAATVPRLARHTD